MQREPVVAGRFYPSDSTRARVEVTQMVQAARGSVPQDGFFAGLVPHAGWAYSGAVAATTFAALAERGTPKSIVLFGAVHRWGGVRAALFAHGGWDTPLGPIQVDDALAGAILREACGEVAENPGAHSEEHSIEVQLPFVRYLFPEAQIVPLMVPPTEGAIAVGEIMARAAEPRRSEVLVVGTTDLTHYGPNYGFAPRGVGQAALAWAKANDRRLLDDIVRLQPEEIITRAEEERSACGAGAIAATVAVARAWGAIKGVVLAYTTSHDVQPRGTPADFVGYASVVF